MAKRLNLKLNLKIVKKARSLGLGAFFMLGVFHSALASCPAQGPIQWYQLERVVDGDTLHLKDGQKVRLLGINTPEIGRGKPDQPLAQHSKRMAEAFFAGDSRVGLQAGSEPQDRYDRSLAHVFNNKGHSLAAQLLAEGMGWLVVIAPNTRYAACLGEQRQQARALSRGVWSVAAYQPLKSAQLSAGDAGFRQVTGTIDKVNKSRSSWWLEMGKLAIRVKHQDLPYFEGREPETLLGETVTVSGWIIDRSDSRSVIERGYKPFMVNLSHPLMIETGRK